MRRAFVWIAIGMVALAATAQAEEGGEFTQFLDDSLVVAAHGFPVVRLMARDPVKRETGRRLTDAVLFQAAITNTLKLVIDSPRPNGTRGGFPSGHTSAAFAVAMALAEREPDTAIIAFPLAAVAGWARVDLDAHYWWQVVAGALVGLEVGHMCGQGKWRLFGEPDRELPAEATSLVPEATWDTPVSAGVRPGYVWTATVWSTTF